MPSLSILPNAQHWTCPGCRAIFASQAGYARHLTTSRRLECRNAYAAGLSNTPLTSQFGPGHRLPASSSSRDYPGPAAANENSSESSGSDLEAIVTDYTPSTPGALLSDSPGAPPLDDVPDPPPTTHQKVDFGTLAELLDSIDLDTFDSTQSPKFQTLADLMGDLSPLLAPEYASDKDQPSDHDEASDLDQVSDQVGGPEHVQEPERPFSPNANQTGSDMDLVEEDAGGDAEENLKSLAREHPFENDELRTKPTIVSYPDRHAGAPVPSPPDEPDDASNNENPYAPFASQLDWEIARWAKLRGPSSTAFTELLGVDSVRERLGLGYLNVRELNKIIDQKLTTRRPRFLRQQIVIGGEPNYLYFRDIVQCVRALWGDPDFADHLIFKPERHYQDPDCTIRMYHDMHTAKWWWNTQKSVDRESGRGGTIVPIIISSDKTTLTQFGGKSAYPVYMTIGNLPKELRRKPSKHAYVLLGYLPIPSLKRETKAGRRRMTGNLFHLCMAHILAPLRTAGVRGIVMKSGDGKWRRCHLIFSTFVGDYPEQCLVACTKRGECPVCTIHRDDIGESISNNEFRDLSRILDAFETLSGGTPAAFTAACREAGVKEFQNPFWKDLPYANIYHSITPDILHQLYQGVVKHLIGWLRKACGDKELDARCRRLPPNHQMRHFTNGFTHFVQVTGREHAQISSVLLGIILGIRLRNNIPAGPLASAVRAILDFLFLAQYPVHTTQTLAQLDGALERFHENKHIFIDLGIRKNFQIPKLHFAEHFADFIRSQGTTDNYNTEYTERLHIDFAKDAYDSTNRRDEFPQMTLWLERKEKIFEHERLIQWRLERHSQPRTPHPRHIPIPSVGVISSWTPFLPKHPSAKRVTIEQLSGAYKATQFKECLAEYITWRQNPTHSWRRITREARSVDLPPYSFRVYHTLKFREFKPYNTPPDVIVDIVHAAAARKSRNKREMPARFDTVLINDSGATSQGPAGYRVAQVRAIFTLPPALIDHYLPDDNGLPTYFAYVELFTPLRTPDATHGLYRVKRWLKDAAAVTRIVPLSNIRRSVHLIPQFGRVADPEWTSGNVLDQAPAFYVNVMSDRNLYYLLQPPPSL